MRKLSSRWRITPLALPWYRKRVEGQGEERELRFTGRKGRNSGLYGDEGTPGIMVTPELTWSVMSPRGKGCKWALPYAVCSLFKGRKHLLLTRSVCLTLCLSHCSAHSRDPTVTVECYVSGDICLFYGQMIHSDLHSFMDSFLQGVFIT